MKKTVLILSTILVGSLTLFSFENGPAELGAGNCTGSTGAAASCSGTICHSPNTSNTIVQIKLIDSLGNIVTNYHPGSTYKVKITGTNSASQPGFGFQLSVVNSSKKQIGTFSLRSTPKDSIHISYVVAPLQIVEHSNAFRASIPGNYIVPDFFWTAPASDSGNATFYVMLNAVDLNGNNFGDQPNSGTPLVITPALTSVATLAQSMKIKTYPNPVHTSLNIQISNAAQGNYIFQVFDLNGRKIFSKDTEVSSLDFHTSINTASWTTGIHLLQIINDGMQHTIVFVKQ